MTAYWLFLLLPALPVLLAPCLLLPRLGLRLLPWAPWVPLTALVLLGWREQWVSLPWLLLGTRLGLDSLGSMLLLLAVPVWTLAGLYARHSLPPEQQQRFFFFWLLTWCGNSSVLLTLDGASFYAAYALMTFAAYGLVVHQGRAEDFWAGKVYLMMALFGEGCLLAGLLLLGLAAGNPDLTLGPQLVAGASQADWITGLLLLGFGVKMGMLGLHVWLPLAHPQAPVAASAVLSGVILKAGLVGWLRLLPLGSADFTWAGHWLLLAGLAGAAYGVLVGLWQHNAKVLLAYSSISQMGLLLVLLALALLVPDQAALYMLLAGLFAVHHGLAKACLFLGVDLARRAPGLMRALLWLPALVLVGAPLTSGALVKLSWKLSLPAHLSWLELALLVSSLGTALLMARLLWLSLTFAAEGRRAYRWQLPLIWCLLLTLALSLPWLLGWWWLAPLPLLALQPALQWQLVVPLLLAIPLWLLAYVWSRWGGSPARFSQKAS